VGAFGGNAVLFYAAYRNQKWSQSQGESESCAQGADKANVTSGERGAESAPNSAEQERLKVKQENTERPITQADFDRMVAETLARPYFDRKAYLLLCAGFAVTAIAALLDIFLSLGSP
jgi:hypothetical protein